MTAHVCGIDLGKTVFHLVGLSKEGHIVVKKRFSRKQLLTCTANMPVCLIGMEACGISKRGDPYLRRLLIHGDRSVLARVKRNEHSFGEWLNKLKARAPQNVAVVAMANKLARIAWGVLTSGKVYSAAVCS